MATLISVEVIEDGAAILLTVECSDEVAQLFEGTESKVRQGPPAHDLTMPHDILFNPDKARGCPPNCPYRKWTEAQNDD